jgi:hypothetical protein
MNMFGIIDSVIRTATRLDDRPETEFDKERRILDPEGAKRRHYREEMERPNWLRTRFW